MEQFSLEKWLKDKSRKVVTRTGKPVRIVCWDAPTRNPIYGFVEGDDGITSWRKDGRFSNLIDNVDLFFADEEEELTNFEKAVQNILNEPHFQDVEAVKQFSKTLLDLAKKEIFKDFVYGYVSLCHDYPHRRSLVAVTDGLVNFEYAEKVRIIICKTEQQ